MIAILIEPLKVATLSLLDMKVFSNNGYDAMIFVLDVNNNTFSRDSNYIIDVVR